MASRRSPDVLALELLDCVEKNGEATKWDLIKVLGNETQFRIWVEDFFLRDKVLLERREGRHYFYRKTERGELFHRLLKNASMVKLLSRVSARRLRQ